MRCLSGLFGLIALALAASRESRDAFNAWEKYIYSPASRTYSSYSLNAKSDNVSISSDQFGHVFHMPSGSSATFDWGVEVGGYVSFLITTSTNSSQFSLAYNESPFFIRAISDDTGAVPTENYDKAYNASVVTGTSYFIMPSDWFRGGFRFTTITAHEDITISNLTCEIGFDPGKSDLRDYSGYFYAPNDETLVKAWYAGAYTVQTNIAPQDTGRFLPQVKPGWDYNASLGVGSTFLLDGAKRDRAVWPGDLGISGTTCMLSMGESGWAALLGSLETMFYYQNASSGELPFAGPDTASFKGGSQSDTYHAWGLIAIYNYAIFTGDEGWLNDHWSNTTRAVNFIVSNLDSTGLQNQTQTNDWARQGGGGYNSALNALDYHVLHSFVSLATALGGSYASSVNTWSTAATKLKSAYNTILYNSSAGLYNDNQTMAGALLHPQDGNALALFYNLTTSPSQAQTISTNLINNWNSIGPVTPELPDTISPFISGIEVLAHFAAGQTSTAFKLMRQLWGYLLTAPQFTGSTLVEGITANGSLYYRSTAGYNYDAAYTSLSHGWSSAPTQALTFYVAGLSVSGWREWRFAPQVGDLSAAEAGFVLPLGSFAVSWEVFGDGEFLAEVTVPEGMEGSVELSYCQSVQVNGKEWKGGKCKGTTAPIVVSAKGCK